MTEERVTYDAGVAAPGGECLAPNIVMAPLDRVKPWIGNPRADCGDLAELTASIAEHGVLQPLTVRPSGANYLIIAGERRYRAAREAGLATVPCIVRQCGDREALELALVENLQRRDLNAIEEAYGYAALHEIGLTQEQIAERVNRSRPAVANALRLLQLPFDVQAQIRSGALTASHGHELLGLVGERDAEYIAKVARRAAREAWTTAQVRQAVLDAREALAPRLPEPAPEPVDAPAHEPRVCRNCTGTEEEIADTGDTWVEPDLCSVCAPLLESVKEPACIGAVPPPRSKEPACEVVKEPEPAPTAPATEPVAQVNLSALRELQAERDALAAEVERLRGEHLSERDKEIAANGHLKALRALVDALEPTVAIPGLQVGAIIRNWFSTEYRVEAIHPPRPDNGYPNLLVGVKAITSGTIGGALWSLSMMVESGCKVIKPAPARSAAAEPRTVDATCPLCGAPDLGVCDCDADAVNAALAGRVQA